MIKVLKLTNGDDIIADVENSSESIAVKNAYRIVMTPEGLGLMPFMLFSKDKNFVIASSNVLASGEPEEEIRNAYSSQTGGVVVPVGSNMLITE